MVVGACPQSSGPEHDANRIHMKGQLRGKMKQIHELINIKELNLPEDNVE